MSQGKVCTLAMWLELKSRAVTKACVLKNKLPGRQRWGCFLWPFKGGRCQFFKIPNKNVPGNISDSISQTSAHAHCGVHADVDLKIDERVHEGGPRKFSHTHMNHGG